MLKPNEEAQLIIDALHEDYGYDGNQYGECPYIDGRKAVLEMKAAGFPGWAQVEWAGFYLKFLIQNICSEKLSHEKIEPFDLGRNRHFIKGSFVWDTRFHANDDNMKIPLGDLEDYNAIAIQNGGIGIIIVDSVAKPDNEDDFRRWHEEIKGGPSNYTIIREIEGRRPQPRKKEFFIKKVLAYFFSPTDFQTGIQENWMDTEFQDNWRNADESDRNSKYRLHLTRVPQKYLVYAKNFNEDPIVFAETYPEYS